jgi:hypothetical protein
LEGGSEFFEFVLDFFEGGGAEGGGDLHQGEDGVGGSDLGELGEDGLSLLFVGLECGELFDDEFECSDDFGGLALSSGEFIGVLCSGFSQVDFSLVEDV